MPVILATQEAEIRRIKVQRQPRQIVRSYLEKNPSQKRAGGVAQTVGHEFKPQYHQKRKRKKRTKTISLFCFVLFFNFNSPCLV
jgi:hypothetical protein